MDKVLELTKELKEEINKLPEMQEYLRLKELLENDNELADMRKEIARLANQGKIQERDNLLKIYNSHPLVSNYYTAKEEIEKILNTIKTIIQ